MRVLQVINRLNRGGGAEKFVLDLGIALKQRHVSVEVLSLGMPQNTDLIDEAAANGIIHNCLSHSTISWKNIVKLRLFIAAGRYDVVHVHLFPALYMVVLACAFIKKRPKLVYTEHSTSNKRRNKRFFKFIEHYIYRKYSRVVAISDEVANKLKEHARIDNISIIHNGVDIHKIERVSVDKPLKNELGLSSTSKIITMVGRFVPGKDFSTLIQSLSYLPENVHIVCVGDGPLRYSIQTQTLRKSYADRVHFLGLRSDVIRIIKSSDIIVLSTEHEGFSISMLEAMACGKPFVASAVPGIKDVVADNAILFEYQDPNGLAKQISLLLDDPKLYSEMSTKSLAFAKCHDMNEIAKLYMSIYEQRYTKVGEYYDCKFVWHDGGFVVEDEILESLLTE